MHNYISINKVASKQFRFNRLRFILINIASFQNLENALHGSVKPTNQPTKPINKAINQPQKATNQNNQPIKPINLTTNQSTNKTKATN